MRKKNRPERAVSRILSAPGSNPGGEYHLSERPEPGTRSAQAEPKRATSTSPIWPCTRWGFPCLVACAPSGGLLPHLFTLAGMSLRAQGLRKTHRRSVFCGTVRRDASRRRRPRVSCWPRPKAGAGYAASCPVVFGLSSPDRTVGSDTPLFPGCHTLHVLRLVLNPVAPFGEAAPDPGLRKPFAGRNVRETSAARTRRRWKLDPGRADGADRQGRRRGFAREGCSLRQGPDFGAYDDKARENGPAPQQGSDRAAFKRFSGIRAPPASRRHKEGTGLCLRSVPVPAGPTAPPLEPRPRLPEGSPSEPRELAWAISVAVRGTVPPRFRKPERTGAVFRAGSGDFQKRHVSVRAPNSLKSGWPLNSRPQNT